MAPLQAAQPVMRLRLIGQMDAWTVASQSAMPQTKSAGPAAAPGARARSAPAKRHQVNGDRICMEGFRERMNNPRSVDAPR